MSITAVFLQGQTAITVNGLHQWDYGQQLEIHTEDTPGLIEVHFACLGMKEAVVRSCAMVNGVGSVIIPDTCLEQSAPIMAWIYEIDGTKGATTKTITLNVTPRAKPSLTESIPKEISDKYTEALTAMNEQVESLKTGEVVVKKAKQSTSAEYAVNADYATSADYADEATSAETAGALTLPYGLDIGNRVLTDGIYSVIVDVFKDGAFHKRFQTALTVINGITGDSRTFLGEFEPGVFLQLYINTDGVLVMSKRALNGDTYEASSDCTIKTQKIADISAKD